MEQDLALLEQKVASLIAHVRALRADNEALRRELAGAQADNQALQERMANAGARLDAVLSRLPLQ
jgi:outer membrane murein-binding lipoprotein Lpp